jgi:hypothetical protein
LDELKAEPFDEKLRHKSNCLRQLTRMNSNKMSKIRLNCAPNDKDNLEDL